MTDLRTAAQQALEALELHAKQYPHMQKGYTVDAITALRAALAEPTVKESLQVELAPEPGDFDHGIGADRFKVVRGAFWWHVLIGDSPTEHGKFHSRASAEKMAAALLREFRNGAFVQHEAALAEPQSTHSEECWKWHHKCAIAEIERKRKPLTDEQISDLWHQSGEQPFKFARMLLR